MDNNNKVQTNNVPAIATTPTATAINKPRINHNFILVPAGNFLTNNNLIPTNHNSIMNKGKIMILTTTPAINQAGTGAAGNSLTNPQCVQIRPNVSLTPSIDSSGLKIANATNFTGLVGSTTSTNILANIKINPISNQSTTNPIQQISTVPISADTISVATNNTGNVTVSTPITVLTNNSSISNQFQMFTPIVPANTNTFTNNTNSNNNNSNSNNNNNSNSNCNSNTNNNNNNNINNNNNNNNTNNNSNNNNNNNNNNRNSKLLNTIRPSPNLKPNTISFLPSLKAKTNSISTSISSNNSISTPLILNGSDLFLHDKQKKALINLNFVPNKIDGFKDNNIQSKTFFMSIPDRHYTVTNNNGALYAAGNDKNAIIGNILKTMEQTSIKRDYLKSNQEIPNLTTDEKLDRSSPELWPESVPGVSKYLSNNSTRYDLLDVFNNEEEYESENENDENKIENKIKTEEMDEIIEIPDDDDENDGANDVLMNKIPNSLNNNQDIKRMVQSFSITNYGLESIIEKMSDKDNEKENEIENEVKEEKIKKEFSKVSKTVKPDWHKDYGEDELSMIYGYASLTSTVLMEKIGQIQNFAFQLGLDEEREVARARYLDILHDPGNVFDDVSNILLDKEIKEIFKNKNSTPPIRS